MLLVGLIRVYTKLCEILAKPKLRVRKLDMETGYYVWGTVDKVTNTERDGFPNLLTHWTVVWDDKPTTWSTVPSYSFLWHIDAWTLIQR